MTEQTAALVPQPKYRLDYHEPDYWIDTVDLRFELGETETLVEAELHVRVHPAQAAKKPPLVLTGEELDLRGVWVNGRTLSADEYAVEGKSLTIRELPAKAVVKTQVAVRPQENTSLSGLYQTSGNFCTQCEAEGFRRITYFLDRPDVMARYTTTIVGDPGREPVMLSNGNRVGDGTLEDGRHWVRWEDPHKKPSYLFALVAGQLRSHSGEFTTKSGRKVQLEIWVEERNIDLCEHALVSLQKSMAWDEEVFGLEYDLDLYMIVAVDDFNMGAMENKGLNVFNSKFVLARPETATDDDYEHIEGVIAHEYFHNWTGNRVTCRDWFQLTLKEGLTVYRDQRFTADMTSAAIKRIQDVRGLRAVQFAEDAGPMAHPIRPESYIEMNNFYTATVYEKGSEVVRMYETLLGREGFRKGMDLYFERHDGQAVTCDDFRAAMADSSGLDLTQFGRWYEQPGTPKLLASATYDERAKTFELTFRQSNAKAEDGGPLHIPIKLGLVGRSGKDLELKADDGTELRREGSSVVFELREASGSIRFQGVPERPVPSILRGFSAPVRLEMDRTDEELAFLWGNDPDSFNRWDAGQELSVRMLLARIAALAEGRTPSLPPAFVEAFGRVLRDDSLDGSARALALSMPGERFMAQELEVVDPERIYQARHGALCELSTALEAPLLELYDRLQDGKPYSPERTAIDRRRLKNLTLGLVACPGGEQAIQRAQAQFDAADNMTDSAAALMVLANHNGPQRDAVLSAFYERWKAEPLVLDKWFQVQALCSVDGSFERVLALAEHPDFKLSNPNRVRSLLGAFAHSNPRHFHRADGKGYRFVGDRVLELDKLNPQIASRLVSSFNAWKRYEPGRRALMGAELERFAAADLSRDVFEIVSRAK